MIAEAPKAVFPVPQAINDLISQATSITVSHNPDGTSHVLSTNGAEHGTPSSENSHDTITTSSHHHESQSHSQSYSQHHTDHNYYDEQPQSPTSNWIPSPISTHNPWNNRPLSAFDPDWTPSPIEPSPVDHHFSSQRFNTSDAGQGQVTSEHHDKKHNEEKSSTTTETRS